MAKTDQDQHLKLSPQRYISFLKAFFDKKHSRIPQVNNIHGKNYLSPPGTHFFFLILLWKEFQNLGLKVVDSSKKGEADVILSQGKPKKCKV